MINDNTDNDTDSKSGNNNNIDKNNNSNSNNNNNNNKCNNISQTQIPRIGKSNSVKVLAVVNYIYSLSNKKPNGKSNKFG